MLNISEIRKQFPSLSLEDDNGNTIIYLDGPGGAQLARAAGSSTQIVGKSDGYVAVKLPSGEQRKVREECKATIGVLSNIDNKNKKLGKAGRNRWLGIRPSVRGVAMNPIAQIIIRVLTEIMASTNWQKTTRR